MKKVSKKRIDPVKNIDITLVSEGPRKGWVRTVGMARFGKPELEMRNVPLFLFGPAGEMLNGLADMLLNETHDVKAGESIQFNDLCVFRVVRSAPFDDKSIDGIKDNALLASAPHWTVIDEPMEGMCTLCNSGRGLCPHSRPS